MATTEPLSSPPWPLTPTLLDLNTNAITSTLPPPSALSRPPNTNKNTDKGGRVKTILGGFGIGVMLGILLFQVTFLLGRLGRRYIRRMRWERLLRREFGSLTDHSAEPGLPLQNIVRDHTSLGA
ncbi:hypothetical protein GGR55DRAFT_673386 [Xylaria sp. FL0064]|nr:hypothetical protein GGR55DRAFT_673386 [Xylaria sp. FL0064]